METSLAMAAPITFVSPEILQRIQSGAFTPARRSQPDARPNERRDVLSPLAVTKRCVRYEPNVFHHRQALILKLAAALNAPARKITLVGGAQGCGKTSLVRGVIELMGSHNEQLLWFDANRHTDFEEIIQFLIQYITYICTALGGVPPPTDANADAVRKLEGLLGQVSEMPLLLVLDNVEYLVDAELRFNSYPFKETLNFLLGFANIKMVLIGERLPYADMSPNQEGVEDIRLEGLKELAATAFLSGAESGEKYSVPADVAVLERAAAPEVETAALKQLYRKTQGQPWLLKMLFHLHHQGRLDFSTLNRLLESPDQAGMALPVSELTQYLYQRLPDQHRRLFHVLGFLRHPANVQALLSLVGLCYPALGDPPLTTQALEDMLEHSLLKLALKINYPPQEVLGHIRQRRAQRENRPQGGSAADRKFKPWYELYHAVKKLLYNSVPVEERERLHGVLQDFYLQEKGREPDSRSLRIKNRALLSEAKYHGSLARERHGADGARARLGDAAGGESLASRAYLSQGGGRGPLSPPPMTLADYRNIRLEEPAPTETASSTADIRLPEGDEAETSLDGPTFTELLGEAAGKVSFQEQLAGIELSPEEKALLLQPPPTVTRFVPLPAQTHEDPLIQSMMTEQRASNAFSKASRSQPEASRQQLESSDPAPDPWPSPLSDAPAEGPEDPQEQAIRQRLTAAVTAQDKTRLVKALTDLARHRASHGRYDSAGECLQKALSLKGVADPETLAEIYRLSGSVNKETYHHNAALPALSKAAAAIQRLIFQDDTVNVAWMDRLGRVYQDLGEIRAYRQQYEEAIAAFQQALRWFQSADDPNRLAETHFQLAGAYEDSRQPEAAIRHYQQALGIDEAHENKVSAAAAWANLANLYRKQGQWEASVASLNHALRLDRESGNRDGQLNALGALAGVYLESDAPTEAERVIRQGLALAVQEGLPLWQASFYLKLGQFFETREDWPEAFRQYQLAISTGQTELSQASLAWLDQKSAEVRRFLTS